MEGPLSDKCADCGKTRSNVASITQWISLGDKCSCGTSASNQQFKNQNQFQPYKNETCPRCGGSLSKQNGSLTQWVFRTTPCKCGYTAEIAKGVSNFSATENIEESYEEIEVDSARFPLERYSPIGLIGSGQQGDVYKAKDKLLSRLVCIKVLKTMKLLPEQIVRFQREAKTGGKLTHPNLTTVLDFGLTEQGQPYLVMELCKGRPLDEVIQEHGAIPSDLALQLFDQICDGMQYAHEHGVLHRDLKSSNILIEISNNEIPAIKIIDFGLSGLLDTISDTGKQVTAGGLLMGTPAYMSPEQVLQQKLDERSDIYSLGCIMFETLTGKKLFTGETAMDVLNKQANDEPPSLSETNHNTEYSEDLEELIGNALEKNPSQRIQSMKALRSRLRKLPENETKVSFPSEDSPSPPRFTLTAPTRTPTEKNFRRPIRLVVAALLLGALVSIGAYISNSILNQDAQESAQNYKITSFYLADSRWTLATGFLHGSNAPKLKLCTEEPQLKVADPELSDQDLPYITGLHLTALDLSKTKVTDRGLKTLTRIKTLKSLILNNNPGITDDGMKTLLLLPELRVVAIENTGVTDKGIIELAKLPKLTLIDLIGLKGVTAKSLHALKSVPDMIGMRIGSTSIKPSDLGILNEFSHLVALNLTDLNLTDADLEQLIKLKSVLLLDVSNNQGITLAGIQRLNPLHYWRISFSDCGLSKEEEEKLTGDLVMTSPTPLPVALELVMPSHELPPDLNPAVYAFWYNPKYADAAFIKTVENEFRNPPPPPKDRRLPVPFPMD